MTSIAWKRKTANVQTKSASLFQNDEENSDVEEAGVEDWTSVLPKKQILEDESTKSKRLVEEGTFLAEQERYWEAIGRFDEALSYKPNESKIYEMKAQALLELSELYPATEAAEMAVKLDPLWAIAHQTLGRTQISCGNIDMALRSFSIALHLKPDFEEVYNEDLSWAVDLREKQRKLQTENDQPFLPCSCSHNHKEDKEEEKYEKLNIMEPS